MGRRPSIGQGQVLPKSIWILVDKSNGDTASRRYLWWFESRTAAERHKRDQHKRSMNARLAGPFEFYAAPVEDEP